ncbi:hypothetical protein [Sphingomonas sp.]|uniref:hypothetical protein n=1 Tax=Sphingomonas sp. TaxID=28214 RepID=UPI00286D7246|nr:hypothetical protein [Sphingomonas sp.]
MHDEALWKRRFLTFTLLRLAGLATFFAGIWIAFGDVVRPGGWPAVGAVLAIMGAIDALFAPRLLKKMWEREDR